jgi:hypothetical protein
MKIHSVVLKFLYTDKQTYIDGTLVAAVLCKDVTHKMMDFWASFVSKN